VRSNLGSAIFGLITMGALIAAESALAETYAETVGAVALSALMYWLVHSYAELAESRVNEGQRLTFGGLTGAMRHEVTVLLGAGVPLIALVLCWVVGATLSTALTVALVSVAAAIVVIEALAGIWAGVRGRELVFHVAVGATMGLLVLVLHVVLHH
jgi:hypothetical protein